MAVRVEKKGGVWTVIHSRPQARNAMDPESADALVSAFEDFDQDPDARVAVLWGEGGSFCAGWDLKYGASLMKDPTPIHEIDYPLEDRKAIPRGPLGPTRLELDKPVIAAVAGPPPAGGLGAGPRGERGGSEKTPLHAVAPRPPGWPLAVARRGAP